MLLWRELLPSLYMQTDAVVSHFRAGLQVNSSEGGRQSMAQSHPQISKTLTSATIQSYWTCASCIMLSAADITILVWVFMMCEDASTHLWHIKNYNALHIRCFFSGQKSTGVRQHLLRRNCSSSSLPFPISGLISTVPTKLMIPALSTMHEEKQKALTHLNSKYSESLEKDKANIKNHKKYA